MAEVNVRVKRFFNQHPPKIEHFVSLEFYHPQAGMVRFVANRYEVKYLGIEPGADRDAGTIQPFQPLTMTVARPEQNGDAAARITVQLGRVGSGMRNKLKQIRDFGFLQPGEAIYREHISDDLTAPTKVYKLFVSTITIQANSVALQLEDDNPINQDISRLYTFEDFPGLEEL